MLARRRSDALDALLTCRALDALDALDALHAGRAAGPGGSGGAAWAGLADPADDYATVARHGDGLADVHRVTSFAVVTLPAAIVAVVRSANESWQSQTASSGSRAVSSASSCR